MDKITLRSALARFDGHWQPKIIGEVNDTAIKLVKFKGPFEWHHHVNEDELFLVLAGRMTMRFRDRDVVLETGDLIIVPRGTEHMPVADEECHVMLVEPKTTLNTGNVVSDRTIQRPERLG